MTQFRRLSQPHPRSGVVALRALSSPIHQTEMVLRHAVTLPGSLHIPFQCFRIVRSLTVSIGETQAQVELRLRVLWFGCR